MRTIIVVILFVIITGCKTTPPPELRYTEKGYSYHTKPFITDNKENSI